MITLEFLSADPPTLIISSKLWLSTLLCWDLSADAWTLGTTFKPKHWTWHYILVIDHSSPQKGTVKNNGMYPQVPGLRGQVGGR